MSKGVRKVDEDESCASGRRVYLAARYSRNAEMREARSALEAVGFEVTSTWIDQHDGTLETSFTPERLGADPEFCSTFAQTDVLDLSASDVVVSFTGLGGGKGGRHVEFGLGVALGKRSIVVGPRENVFHCLPQVEVVSDLQLLIDLLKRSE